MTNVLDAAPRRQWQRAISAAVLCAMMHGVGGRLAPAQTRPAAPPPGARARARAVDRPWISSTYFYWYRWDYQQQWGNWAGDGVYNTPLRGYYDSARYDDNLFGLRQTAEWGLTDQFMDYWSPGWQGENGEPREDVLMRAAEDLKKRGYDIHMSVYQDGTDFDMAQFSRNLDPNRGTRYYVERFARSSVLPKVGGKPLFLVYGRNGAPKITATDAGFRVWLQRKYGTLPALNARWGSNYGAFADIRLDLGGRGASRADSVKYQFSVWQDEMERANAASRQFGLPGVLFSWDVGYTPFLNYGYSDQARVFTGPHSYAGIFDVPHALDTERFIQAAVAKRYNTLFLDTFKNYYHDWEIRIPGICYPESFCAFDRFWVQSLAHYSEGLLHLSWNEWWEGSNMEPSFEHGKTYCETNLLYSTIMRQCFPSIQEWNRGARVAVLLNDWHWLAGGRHPEEIYACVQALRRNNIRFDIVPDDFVTAAELSRFRVIVAPAAGIGFGRNAADQNIADLLVAWAESDPRRKLIVSDYPGLSRSLGLKPATKSGEKPVPGPNMNLFVDVGEPGDDRFLVDGCSGPEDWGRLDPGAYGRSATKHTVRWTPATGLTTSFVVPFSANRDHVLRIRGDANWPNHVAVLVDGVRVAEFDIEPGRETYEVKLPASALHGLEFGELSLKYARANVPTEIDPARFPSENRVCNLAIDWVQLATAGSAFSKAQNYTMPNAGAAFTSAAPGALAGRRLSGSYVKHALLAPAGAVLSAYVADRSPHDMVVGKCGNTLYVNGLLSSVSDESYLDGLLIGWARCPQEIRTHGRDLIVTPLRAGDTDILLAYNYAAPARRVYSLSPPARTGAPPVVEMRVLSRDGAVPSRPDLPFFAPGRSTTGSDAIDYYGVYQVARGWTALRTPNLALAPGESRVFPLKLTGMKSVSGTVRLVSYTPTLTARSVWFRVDRGATVSVPLTITAAPDIDWGTRTVVFDVEVGGRHTYFWRSLLVQRLPDLQVVTSVKNGGAAAADGAAPVISIGARSMPWASDAVARGVSLRLGGVTVPVGDVVPGKPVTVAIPAVPRPNKPALTSTDGVLSYQVGGVPRSSKVAVAVANYPSTFPRPAGAVQPVIVANPNDDFLDHAVVSVHLSGAAASATYVRDGRGTPIPSQLSGRAILWLAILPPKSTVTYYLCGGTPPTLETDLKVTESGGGVTVSNSAITLGWSGKAGGTLTTFRSAVTGMDYAAGTCGAGIGSWGKYDPHRPTVNTIDFVGQEHKLWQRDLTEGTVTVVERGPVYADVKITATRGPVKFSQYYSVYAGQSGFFVMSGVQSVGRAAEAVPLDFRIRRNNLWKLYPNFIGTASALTGSNPSAGWREGAYVPPYTTIMAPPACQEGITLLPHTLNPGRHSPNWYRNGLWTEKRPTAGPVLYADVEYVRKDAASAVVAADVRLHAGTQTVSAALHRTEVDPGYAIIVPRAFTWSGDLPAAGAPPAGWWNSYWHYAMPITVGPLEDVSAGVVVLLKPDFAAPIGSGDQLDPASPRAVVTGPHGVSVLPTTYDAQTGEIAVTLSARAWPSPSSPERSFVLYFDTLANGPKRAIAPPGGARSSRLRNGGFEEGAAAWVSGGGAVVSESAHSGRACMKLEIADGVGPVVVTNTSLLVWPNRQYRVSWWARSTTQGASVATNFNQGPQYDFGQVHVPVIADGEWHRCEAVIPVGGFPAGITPDLRLWILGRPQTVYLDDVDVQPISASGGPSYRVSFGPVSRW